MQNKRPCMSAALSCHNELRLLCSGELQLCIQAVAADVSRNRTGEENCTDHIKGHYLCFIYTSI